MDALNPYRNFVASISPSEFEKYCLDILKGYAETENLPNFTIEHNVKLTASDGTYQIDVYAKFKALGVEFKVIAECKRYSEPISRAIVVVLADKIRSLGAHKGILMSTSGFESGAYQYAKQHGIALLQIFNKNTMHIVNAYNLETEEFIRRQNIMKAWIQKQPDYYAYEYSEMDFPDKKVYPTDSFMENTFKQVEQDFATHQTK